MTHLDLLKSGIEHWNQWRLETKDSSDEPCDLSGQNLSQGYFFEGDFSGISLKGANLRRACLIGADLSGADLTHADLTGAYLGDANLYGANLSNANLTKANLERANLQAANLFGTQFTDADIRTTQLPEAEASPYTDAALKSLITGQRNDRDDSAIAQQSTSQTLLVKRPAAKPTDKSASTAERAALRQSLLAQMSTHLASLTSETRSPTLRQQAIRQSSTPLPAKRIPAKAASNDWGRRQADRHLMARARWHLSKRKVWMPAAVVMLLFIGLPLGFAILRSRQAVAQFPQAEPLALAKSLTQSSQVWAVAARPDANGAAWVIGGGADGQIEMWDGQTGELLRTMSGHESGVRSLAISSSGQWLVSGSQGSLRVWQLSTGQLAYSRQQDSDLDSITARQWDAASTQLLEDFIGSKDDMRTVALNPDGTMLVSNDSELRF